MQPTYLVTKDTGVAMLPPPCDDLDFNNDSVAPDSQDIFDFVFAYGGGDCP